MDPDEFFFLMAGLLLGLATGIALTEVLRARPASRREVRVTVTAAALPGRAATLATTLPDWSHATFDDRDPIERAFTARYPTRAAETSPAAEAPPQPSPGAGRVAVPVGAAPREGPGAATAAVEADPCADERATLDERRGHAERLAAVAEAAAERLRAARLAYDEHVGRRDRAAATMDPRAVWAAKDEAQATFRRAGLVARGSEAREKAAREWLREINRVNRRSRDAAAIVAKEDAREAELLLAVERLGVEADGARIAAEAAGETFREAQRALAACEEAERMGPVASGASPVATVLSPDAVMPPAAPSARAGAPGRRLLTEEEEETLAGVARKGAEPAILRLLRGDRATLRALVERLAGADPEARRRWQLQLTDLVDAILARAIDAAALTFPEGHVFWGPYSQAQCRDISAALAALGFRFDGLGGFADGRVPGQRDLSLAVGYAGQDPMRTRFWPLEAELADLYRDVRVDAGRFLAEAAGGLTLGEMVDLLGRRAEPLSDLWNAWGRVRPLLLGGD